MLRVLQYRREVFVEAIEYTPLKDFGQNTQQ